MSAIELRGGSGLKGTYPLNDIYDKLSDDTRVNNLGLLESENSEGQIEPKQVQRKKMTALEAISTYEAPTGGKKFTDDKTGLLQESTIDYGAHEREAATPLRPPTGLANGTSTFYGAHISATDEVIG